MLVTDPPIIVEQSYQVPVERVWEAITTPDQMRNWFFTEMETFEPTEGFTTKFTIEHDGKTYTHVWKITEAIPNERIVYDWSYEGLAGRGLVTWELSESNGGSKLKLTNAITESFPQDDPAFRSESCEAGWHFFLDEQLKDYLET